MGEERGGEREREPEIGEVKSEFHTGTATPIQPRAWTENKLSLGFQILHQQGKGKPAKPSTTTMAVVELTGIAGTGLGGTERTQGRRESAVLLTVDDRHCPQPVVAGVRYPRSPRWPFCTNWKGMRCQSAGGERKERKREREREG